MKFGLFAIHVIDPPKKNCQGFLVSPGTLNFASLLFIHSQNIPSSIWDIPVFDPHRAFFGKESIRFYHPPKNERQWHVKPFSLSLAEGFFRVTWKLEDPKSWWFNPWPFWDGENYVTRNQGVKVRDLQRSGMKFGHELNHLDYVTGHVIWSIETHQPNVTRNHESTNLWKIMLVTLARRCCAC